MLGVNYDITERKQAEEDLRKLTYLLDEGQKIGHLGTFEYIVSTMQTIWSEEQFRIYGYDPSLPAPNFDTLVAKSLHPDDTALITQTFLAAVNNREIYELEHRILHPNGNVRWVYDKALPSFDQDGQLVRYVGITLDITDRKKASQELVETNSALERALRTKDEFLAAMSHELRTPISSILGMVELLQMTAANMLNDKQSNYLTVVEKSGRRLLDLVNNVLDYTQLQGGTFKPDIQLSILDENCKIALQQISPQAESKQQHVRYLADPPGIKVLTDETWLQKILFLLLENASKFTEVGGEFGIDVIGSSATRMLEVTVWDTGIGIAREDFPRLFKPFGQLDASLARQYEGAGLGLALAKSITEFLGGQITVQSTFGKGSRFIVTLPWDKSESV